MAKHNPRSIVLDGQSLLALTPKEYSELASMRRQMGGQSARLRVLRDELTTLSDFLETLVHALEGDRTSALHPGPKDSLQTLLREAPDVLQHARVSEASAEAVPSSAPKSSDMVREPPARVPL
ncbi:hypothetical protein GTW69_32160 [Streptomyces sp. SID7760]|nr:hypothetical protein [Streptomyces sp. SID7760]